MLRLRGAGIGGLRGTRKVMRLVPNLNIISIISIRRLSWRYRFLRSIIAPQTFLTVWLWSVVWNYSHLFPFFKISHKLGLLIKEKVWKNLDPLSSNAQFVVKAKLLLGSDTQFLDLICLNIFDVHRGKKLLKNFFIIFGGLEFFWLSWSLLLLYFNHGWLTLAYRNSAKVVAVVFTALRLIQNFFDIFNGKTSHLGRRPSVHTHWGVS